MKNTSYTIQDSSATAVTLQRKTAESDIALTLECSWQDIVIEPRLCTWNTGILFLNHMVQIICRRAGINIDVQFRCILKETFAQHVVWEDVGMIIGAGIAELLRKRRSIGVKGAGAGVACIDEALSNCYISFEGRSGCYINIADSEAKNRELVEDAKTQDVRQFFKGFSQGAGCTLHLNMGTASDTHHLWESSFRAFGEAIAAAMQQNNWRKGVIVGVKNVVD